MTFYDTSVNFLCTSTYPLLCTAGMCDVTYIGVRDTYLQGKCFLSALNNDIICLTLPQSTLLFVSSDSSSHANCTSRTSSLCTDGRHTSCRNAALAACHICVLACAANTGDAAFIFLWKANVVNVLLPLWLSWEATGLGVRHPQHTQTGSNW
jgi:hypothetical protein